MLGASVTRQAASSFSLVAWKTYELDLAKTVNACLRCERNVSDQEGLCLM